MGYTRKNNLSYELKNWNRTVVWLQFFCCKCYSTFFLRKKVDLIVRINSTHTSLNGKLIMPCFPLNGGDSLSRAILSLSRVVLSLSSAAIPFRARFCPFHRRRFPFAHGFVPFIGGISLSRAVLSLSSATIPFRAQFCPFHRRRFPFARGFVPFK